MSNEQKQSSQAQPKASAQEAEDSVGKINSSLASSLNSKLAGRASRQDLVNRFIIRDAAKSRQLFKQSDRLDSWLKQRQPKAALVERGLLRRRNSDRGNDGDGDGDGDGDSNAKVASPVSVKKRALGLGALLERRRSRNTLVGMNVIKEEAGVDASLQEAKLRLQKNMNKNKLNSFLTTRASRGSLTRRGILRDRSAEEQVRKRDNVKALLSDFVVRRPTPAKLVEKKIIAGSGAGASANKTAKVVDVPTVVEGALKGKKAVKAAAGWCHSIVLTDDNQVFTFGLDSEGRLGTAADEDDEGDDSDEDAAAGDNAVTAAAAALIGGAVASSGPQLVSSLAGTVSVVDCGDHHSAAVVDGRLFTWGQGSWGRLGLGDQSNHNAPKPVDIEQPVANVSCGAYHTLVLTTDGQVFASGWSKNGRLGIDGTEQSVCTPVRVEALDGVKVVDVKAGHGFSLALSDAGAVYSWGAGLFGALGHGDEADVSKPKQIEALKDVKVTSIAAGKTHALALADDGTVLSWGSNSNGQLGREAHDADVEEEEKKNDGDKKLRIKHNKKMSFSCTPKQVATDAIVGSDAKIIQVAAGKASAFVCDNGKAFAFGAASSGALGTGASAAAKDEQRPVAVAGDHRFVHVASGWLHTLFINDAGALLSCGLNENHRLGF
eukprot:TRINITY_DN67774_c11_g2_i1.p1 TRINITY_DN67774_c11_g2~~TRINITY_DN67774_c11_g2_i1.p1  ORF type:complete len:661 (+),score=358.36 TRINITY_DN67774_c11_g2_i1:110-2092(+)